MHATKKRSVSIINRKILLRIKTSYSVNHFFNLVNVTLSGGAQTIRDRPRKTTDKRIKSFRSIFSKPKNDFVVKRRQTRKVEFDQMKTNQKIRTRLSYTHSHTNTHSHVLFIRASRLNERQTDVFKLIMMCGVHCTRFMTETRENFMRKGILRERIGFAQKKGLSRRNA